MQLARVGVRVLVDVVCVMLVLIARVVVHAVSTQFSEPIFCSWRCTLYKDIRRLFSCHINIVSDSLITLKFLLKLRHNLLHRISTRPKEVPQVLLLRCTVQL